MNDEATSLYGQQMSDILLAFQTDIGMFEVTLDLTREKLLTDLEAMGYEVETFKEWSNEELAQLKLDNEEYLENLNEMIDGVVGATSSMLSSLSSLQQTAAQKNISALDKELEEGNISQEEYENRRMDIEEQALRQQKRNALAQILIDTGMGVAAAIKAGAGLVFPANIAAIASGVASVLAGIANAKAPLSQAVVQGGAISGGSGGGGGGGGGGTEPTAEEVESMIPSQLVENLATETTEQTLQAYVIENDISDAQALQMELEIAATL